MNKFIPYNSANPPLPVISNDRDTFYRLIISRIRGSSEEEFYTWLEKDANFCYLALWLSPRTSYLLFDEKAKLIFMRTQSDYAEAIRVLKSTWKSRGELIDKILSKYADMIRTNSDHIFNQYRNKYERVELSKRYLELHLPFYYNETLVDTYTLKYNRAKEVSSVVFTQWRFPWWISTKPSSQPLTEQTLKIEAIFSTNCGFIPYALCHVFDVLDFLPEELCTMCVRYFLHTSCAYDLIRNEKCRILDFDYPQPKKRRSSSSSDHLESQSNSCGDGD
jgi:hypothetical protein